MKDITLKSTDNYTLHLRVYESDKPQAVIRIIHGMSEHQGRYEDFAAFLADKGYTVVTSDLRGHGKSAPLLSHIADKNGDKLLVSDERVIRHYICSEYAGLPLVLFGHSMGSLIARKVLQTDSSLYKAVILSGYVKPQRAAAVGVLLTKLTGLLKTPQGHASLLTALALGPFARAVPNSKPAEMKWISYNEDNVMHFRSDPLCGREFTIGSYNALFHLVDDIAKPHLYGNVNVGLPILLIAGADDACTGFDKGRKVSLSVLQNAGFTNVSAVTFDNMRHEILNETAYDKVYQIIEDFIRNSLLMSN